MVRYFVLATLFFPFYTALAQSKHRLVFKPHRNNSAAHSRFETTCLCQKNIDELLPSSLKLKLDSLKQISVLLRAQPAVKFKKECEGIYYYLLRSEHWRTPTLRGNQGSFYYYHYFALLNNRLTVFQADTSLNAHRFQGIRRDLIKYLGVQRTDSIKPYLIKGYAEL